MDSQLVGKIFLKSCSVGDREFSLPYAIKGSIVLYYEIFIHPHSEYVTLRASSVGMEDFRELHLETTPEQQEKAKKAFLKGQEIRINRIEQELAEEKAHLNRIQAFARRE